MTVFDSKFASLTDIGKPFGLSPQGVGKVVASAGLRTVGNGPTSKAFEAGMVKKAPTNRGDGNGYFYLWHVARTVALLEAAGYKRVELPDPQPAPTTTRILVGPFSCRVGGGDGYEILNGDGAVFGWARGERVASFIAKLLNLADDHGKLPPI